MSHSPIELKGSSFTLSVVHLNHSDPEVIRLALQDKIQQAPAFLQNAPIVLNVSKLPIDADWAALQQVVISAGLHIVGVSGCNDETQKSILTQAGLPLLKEGRAQNISPTRAPEPIIKTETIITKSRIINTPIRSGQQIYAKNSDLIVTSMVSAGAELVADGNIHIYGVMRGRALAGANGDTTSQIFCTHLSAELVSIAGEYWLSEGIPEQFYGQAGRLRLLDNALTIETL